MMKGTSERRGTIGSHRGDRVVAQDADGVGLGLTAGFIGRHFVQRVGEQRFKREVWLAFRPRRDRRDRGRGQSPRVISVAH